MQVYVEIASEKRLPAFKIKMALNPFHPKNLLPMFSSRASSNTLIFRESGEESSPLKAPVLCNGHWLLVQVEDKLFPALVKHARKKGKSPTGDFYLRDKNTGHKMPDFEKLVADLPEEYYVPIDVERLIVKSPFLSTPQVLICQTEDSDRHFAFNLDYASPLLGCGFTIRVNPGRESDPARVYYGDKFAGILMPLKIDERDKASIPTDTAWNKAKKSDDPSPEAV